MNGEAAVQEVHVCPTCGGSGALLVFPHQHEWRMATSYGGPTFNLQTYVCLVDGCDATYCSDCAAEGLEQCPPPANAKPASAAASSCANPGGTDFAESPPHPSLGTLGGNRDKERGSSPSG